MPPDSDVDAQKLLTWRVHLVRREPHRLPALLFALALGAAFSWWIFGALPPVLAALLLLVQATADFLFPVTYRITALELHADGLLSRKRLRWQEARRCLPSGEGLLITPLATPSRLDAFRGVLVQFAPDGLPGDRASVLTEVRRHNLDLATCLLSTGMQN